MSSRSFAHASHCRQTVSNCALASSKVDTRSERVIGQVTANDTSADYRDRQVESLDCGANATS